MKKTSLLVTLALALGLLTGCVGTPVIYYTECDCPDSHAAVPNDRPNVVEGAVRTGLAVVANAADSKNAAEAAYDVTYVAVTVDDKGVIASCVIDSLGAKVTFDAAGTITSDLNAAILTKNELGDSYGMKAHGGAKYEWNEQARALADYAAGKTVEQLKNGAVDESGRAPAGSDLASTATIYLGGYVSAIEKAVANAAHLGAAAGDELRLAVISKADGSTSASADKAGTAQLDSDVTALTLNDGIITSCVIDSLQAKVSFDAAGTITTDLSAPLPTKNELGESYGMKAYGGTKYEWNEQAASFAAYAAGKTAAEVNAIAVNEKTAPTEADLASSVTIAVGGFQALIAKAVQ